MDEFEQMKAQKDAMVAKERAAFELALGKRVGEAIAWIESAKTATLHSETKTADKDEILQFLENALEALAGKSPT